MKSIMVFFLLVILQQNNYFIYTLKVPNPIKPNNENKFNDNININVNFNNDNSLNFQEENDLKNEKGIETKKNINNNITDEKYSPIHREIEAEENHISQFIQKELDKLIEYERHFFSVPIQEPRLYKQRDFDNQISNIKSENQINNQLNLGSSLLSETDKKEEEEKLKVLDKILKDKTFNDKEAKVENNDLRMFNISHSRISESNQNYYSSGVFMNGINANNSNFKTIKISPKEKSEEIKSIMQNTFENEVEQVEHFPFDSLNSPNFFNPKYSKYEFSYSLVLAFIVVVLGFLASLILIATSLLMSR